MVPDAVEKVFQNETKKEHIAVSRGSNRKSTIVSVQRSKEFCFLVPPSLYTLLNFVAPKLIGRPFSYFWVSLYNEGNQTLI